MIYCEKMQEIRQTHSLDSQSKVKVIVSIFKAFEDTLQFLSPI